MYFSMLSLLACSGEEQSAETVDPIASKFSAGAEVLSLNLLDGERLVNVFYNSENDRVGALYLIHSYKGYILQHKAKRSPVFNRVNQVKSLADQGMQAFVLHVDFFDGAEALMHIEGGEFTLSNKFESIQFGTEYDNDKSAWVGRGDEQSRIIFYAAGQFDYGPNVDRIRDVYPTPDSKTVEYKISRNTYGVNKNLYDSKPQWVTLGNQTLFTAKKDKKVDLVIDYTTKASYKSISAAQKYGDNAALFVASDNKQQFVMSVSGESGSELLSTVGPFAGTSIKRGQVSLHKHTQMPQLVGDLYKEIDGKKSKVSTLNFMGAGNKWSTSSEYKSIQIQSDVWKSGPTAIAKSDEGVQVLRGTSIGPQLSKVQSLVGAFEGSKIAYVGIHLDGQQSVLINESSGNKFKGIRNFSVTKNTQIPFYIAQDTKVVEEKDVGFEKVFVNTTASNEVDKVRTLLTRSNDGIVWLATVSESSAVGINTNIDKSYDSIAKIYLTSNDALWYDGVKSGLRHRVIETKHSRGYNQLSTPIFSSSSAHMLYSGRVETVSTAEDGLSTFKDYVSKNNDDVADFSHSPTDTKGVKLLLSAKTLPQIKTAKSNDSFYYVASSDTQKFVGLNSEKWGAFDDVAQIQFTPTEGGLVYTAKKNEKWAVHENATRHKDFDIVKKLRFTLDKLYVRYEATLEKESFAVVNKEVYQAVTNEQMNRNRDLFVYQGKKSDKWHQVVNYQESEAQNALSKVVWTNDGYGIETVAKTDAGAHLLQKHHGKDFVRLGAYTKASTSKMHYLPFATAFTAEISESNPDSVVLKDREDKIIDISALRNVGEKIFLSVGSSVQNTRVAWLIKEVKDNRLVLQNPPSKKQLEREFGRRIDAFVLPLHSPFTYYATKAKTKGEVFEENHYKSLDNKMFTDNRNFLMRGKNSDGHKIVFEGSQTKSFPSISKTMFFHPSGASDDWVAFKAFDSAKTRKANSQFVLTNKSAGVTELGYAKRTSFDRWTALSSKGEHTIVWSGSDSQRGDFEAVGERRFDQVRNVGISSNLEHLNYVASEKGFEFVYHKGQDHPAYYKIRSYSIQGPNDNATYIGRHVLSRDDQSQKTDLYTMDRYIEHVLNGEESTPWFEQIRGISAGDDLSNTSFVGYQDGFWALYKGNSKIGQDYDQIEWYTSNAEGNHFIGKQKDGWHEVHNLDVSAPFESILPLPNVSRSVMSSWETLRGDTVPNAFVNGKGEFLFMTKDGENEQLHFSGKEYESVRSVLNVWLLSALDGSTETFAYSSQQRDGQQFLHVKGNRTTGFDSIISEPVLIGDTGDVFTVINQASQEEKRFDSLLKIDPTLDSLYSTFDIDGQRTLEDNKKLNDYVALNNILLPQPQALLKNTNVELLGEEISLLTTAKSGVICLASQGSTQQVYHSGDKSTAFHQFEDSAYWGENLADSRYLVSKLNEDDISNVFLYSSDSLVGPFEEASLHNYMLKDEKHHVVLGKNNHQSKLFINEVDAGSADEFTALSEEGRSVFLRKYDEVYNFNKFTLNSNVQTLGDQEFSYLGSIQSSEFNVDSQAYSLLMRLKNDKLSLQHGSVVSETADLAWDLHVQETDGDIEWSWLDGDINYDDAKVSIKVTSLSIPKESASVQMMTPTTLK